jgi:hypothetical protein
LPRAARALVLYNKSTGAVFAIHYFGAADGVDLPDEDELERVALANAARDGCNARTHKVLHVDPSLLRPGVSYRVSIAKRTLVEAKRRGKGPSKL